MIDDCKNKNQIVSTIIQEKKKKYWIFQNDYLSLQS